MGLPELVPLDMANMAKSLGPGYTIGYFAFANVSFFVDRRDNCIVPPFNVSEVGKTFEKFSRDPGSTLPELLDSLHKTEYHQYGHLNLEECGGPSAYSEVAARDPLFYRWHRQVSNLIEDTLEKISPG